MDKVPRRSSSAASAASAGDLSEWLAATDDATVAALLQARPDVTAPPPSTFEVLAARLALPQTATREAARLDLPTATTLLAAEAAGAFPGPVALADIDAALPHKGRRPAGAKKHLADAVDRLRGVGLLWGPDSAIRMTAKPGDFPARGQIVLPAPGDPKPAEVAAALDGDERVKAMLARLARGSVARGEFSVRISAGTREVLDAAVSAGVARLSADSAHLWPSAGALYRLRYGAGGADVLAEPEWPGTTVSQASRDGSGGVAAIELDHAAQRVLSHLGGAPVGQLRGGGVGIRELRRLAAATGEGLGPLVVLLETLYAAGLIFPGDSTVGEEEVLDAWAPTPAADRWLAAELPERLATLAAAWWQMPLAPWQPEPGADEPGKTHIDVPVLAIRAEDRWLPGTLEARHDAFAALGQLPEDGETTAEDFPELVRWLRPSLLSGRRMALIRQVVDQARGLGLVAGWGLTTPGRALLAAESAARDEGRSLHSDAGADELRTLLSEKYTEILPAPVSDIIVQADNTILAPGPLTAELAAEVGAMADVETTGAATTYRLSDSSIRAALDSGRTADSLLATLRTASITPVPQSIEYLIADTARRHGTLRVGSAAAFLRSDDHALVAELAGSQLAQKIGLRQIAPTVLISHERPHRLLRELRLAGYSPVAEDTTGQLVDLARSEARVSPDPAEDPGDRRRLSAWAGIGRRTAEQAVATMRSAEKAAGAAGAKGGSGRRTGIAAVSMLHEAAETSRPVAIAVVDAAGRTSSGMLLPLRVAAGRVSGVDPLTEEHREYALARIISVSPAP